MLLLQIFLQYLPHASFNDTYRYVKDLRWPSADGKLPADEPVCGFRGDKCKEIGMSSSTLAVAVGLPLVVFALLLVAGSFFFLKFWWVLGKFFSGSAWLKPRSPVERQLVRTFPKPVVLFGSNFGQNRVRSDGSACGMILAVPVYTSGANPYRVKPDQIIITVSLSCSITYRFIFRKLRKGYNPNWWKITTEELDVKNLHAISSGTKSLKSLVTKLDSPRIMWQNF